MEGFAGKVAAVTGAGSGIGQALAVELARSGAKVAISDVDTEGLARTEEQLKAIGAPVKVDRLDVTEREAFLPYADAGQRALRQGQPDLQQRRDRLHRRHRSQPVQGHREGDGCRLLGRRQRHQSFSAASDRVRRRPRHQRLQRVRVVVGARAGRLQLGQVRRPRLHRGAAQEMVLAGHPVKVTTVHPGGIKTAIARNATAAEGVDPEGWPRCSTSGWPVPARNRPRGSSWTGFARTRPGCWSARRRQMVLDLDRCGLMGRVIPAVGLRPRCAGAAGRQALSG